VFGALLLIIVVIEMAVSFGCLLVISTPTTNRNLHQMGYFPVLAETPVLCRVLDLEQVISDFDMPVQYCAI